MIIATKNTYGLVTWESPNVQIDEASMNHRYLILNHYENGNTDSSWLQHWAVITRKKNQKGQKG